MEGRKLKNIFLLDFYSLWTWTERGRGREETVGSDLLEFCGIRQRDIQSEDFLDALLKTAALDGTLRDDKPVEEVEIPVRVLYRARQPFSAIGDRPVEELMKAARAEKAIKAEWSEYSRRTEIREVERGPLRCTFVLEPMIADFGNLPVRANMTETMSTLISDNLWFSRVTLYLRIDSKLKVDETLARQAFGQLVKSVFGSTCRCHKLSSTKYCSKLMQRSPLQLGTVVVYCDPSLTSSEFEALCSAMVVEQTTKRLILSLWLDPKDPNRSATRWKWLAYALFSKRARASSALEYLTLTSIGSMSIADMEAFKAVLASEHPEEELFGTTHGHVNERKGNVKSRNPSCVRTFNDDSQSEWVNAIIPVYGKCLVRRDDLIFEQDFDENQCEISSLTIGFNDFNAQAMDGLRDFLAAVGSSLKVLALDAMRINFDVNFILQCCPNLEELSLRSLVIDVRFNFREWHERSQPLPTFDTDWTDAVTVATELQDSCSSFTKALRRLRVRLNNVRDATEVHDEARIQLSVAEMLQMLAVNQSLEYLDIIAPSNSYDAIDSFRMHHLKPISRPLPLPVVSKMAFLSIFSICRMETEGCEELWSGTVHYELDQHVLSKIYQFAAPAVLRRVFFRELDWVDKYNEVPI